MKIKIVALALAAVCGVAASARAEVRVALNPDGRVSITANNATVREILAEWAKVGKMTVVNGERIAGGPITIQLTNVFEEQALDVILRTVSAYLAAPRPARVENASRFDRIVVLPTSTPPRNTPQAPTPTFTPPPAFNPPPPPITDDDDVAGRAAQQRGPIFNTFPQPQGFPQPQVGQPPPQLNLPNGRVMPAPNPTAPTTQSPIGVSVPGMVVPVPAQQGQQPGQFQQDR